MGPAQMRQQLHLGLVADDGVGAFNLDAGLVEVGDQASTRTSSTSGSCLTVIRHVALRSGLLTLLEPVFARREDQLARALRREIGNLGELVDRLLGQVLTGDDAVPRELS